MSKITLSLTFLGGANLRFSGLFNWTVSLIATVPTLSKNHVLCAFDYSLADICTFVGAERSVFYDLKSAFFGLT